MTPRALRFVSSLVALGFAGILTGCAADLSDTAKLEARAKVSRAAAEKTAVDANPGAVLKGGGIEDENGRLIWSFGLAKAGAPSNADVKVDATTGELIPEAAPAPAPVAAPVANAEISKAAEAGEQDIAKGGSAAEAKARAKEAEARIKEATAAAEAKINAAAAAAAARIDAALAEAAAKSKADAEAEDAARKKAAVDAAAAAKARTDAATAAKAKTDADARASSTTAATSDPAAAKLKAIAEGEIPTLQALLNRYADAWARHDTATIVKLYPGISSQRTDLSTTFDKIQSSNYSLDKCVFTQRGRTADAACTETWSNVGKDAKDTGKGQRQQQYALEKQGNGSWLIKSIR